MKSNSMQARKRWVELLEKHKDQLQIENIDKLKQAFMRNKNSWGLLFIKADLLCLEYPLKGENNGKRRTTKNEPRPTDNE